MKHILKEQLLISHLQTSLLFTAPLLMLAIVGVPAGFIADRIGVKKATGIGLIILFIGALARSLAVDYTSLLAATFVFGFGFGWTFPNLPKLVATFAHQDRVTIATGMMNFGMPFGVGLALAITMPILWPITNTYQGVFLIWSIPLIAVTIIWWLAIKEVPKSSAGSGETVKYSTALRKVLTNKNLVLVAILMFLHNFYFYTWTGWTPVLMISRGATADWVGLVVSLTTWAYVPSLLFIPRLSHRFGVRRPFLWVPSVVAALLAWGATRVSIEGFWFLMPLVGVAMASRFITIMALPVELVEKDKVGIASGLVLAIGYSGAVVGPLVGGTILDVTFSFNQSLLILIGLSIAATIIALKIRETGPGKREFV